ncbi:ubiquitin specific protease 20/33 isoform X2 [Arctopsyche grandis]|uniref:ubiquitin specific protease 20/33 isoform X2 n=1 Tax=Arctopsyche grandis TaxID=121162 RepID=UPI00406D6F15
MAPSPSPAPAPAPAPPGSTVVCPHIEPAPPNSPHLAHNQVLSCTDCGCNGPNLWICLQRECSHVGCSENHDDHSTTHYKENPLHCVHMNVTNRHVWCYECRREVFPFMVFTTVSHLPETFVNNYGNQVGNNVSGGLKGAGERLRNMTSFGLERGPGLNVSGAGDSQDSSDADDEDALDASYDGKPRGLVGLQNIGNTCYMNSAIQALSNTPPLTQYFLDCAAMVDFLTDSKKPGVSRSYQKLVKEIWNKKTRGYVVPNGILYGIRNVHPMFRGYHQHDTQEFLRCFIDQLHEELKEPLRENKDARKVPSDAKYITKQPVQQNSLANHVSSGSCQAIMLRSRESDDNVKEMNRRQRSFDNIPSANRYHRVHTQNEDGEINSNGKVHFGHRRSASYCDPCGYSQLSQNVKSELPNSSSRPASPLHCMDQESSEKDLEDDDEETYETCDSGASDTGSLSGEDNFSSQSSIGFKRKHENVEKRSSESETASDTSGNTTKYRSVISDVFDGRLLSSVQCLTCDRISTRVETFKDLSLPIPSRDHMAVLHNGASSVAGTSSNGSTTSSSGRSTACSDAVYSATSSQEGWVWWLLGWLRSWFYGPAVTLHDCLAAFFSADELKGDNMYSCEKCNKLRNGVKFSKVLSLPEILCVHLKRFRHELMSSTKIGAKVSFPLNGLDMRPYMHKDCTSTVSTYELVSIICHTGTAGAGHYTCVARNRQAARWFEFDDQYVTGLTPEQVAACEGYVLFYKKVNPRMAAVRQKALELLENARDINDAKYFISKQWINRFNTYAEPGPIDNSDFLCPHGGVPPDRVTIVERLTSVIPQVLWEFLYQNFGGGPVCDYLHICAICRAEAEQLQKRQKAELQLYTTLHYQFSMEQEQDIQTAIYAINMNWLKLWLAFARNKTQQIPPPIDNSGIVLKTPIQENHVKSTPAVLASYDYAQINEDLWNFFYGIYGGGPEVKLKSAPVESTCDYQTYVNGSYGNFSEHPSYNSVASSSRPSITSNYDKKESDSDDGPHTKSQSNVDLFTPENRNDFYKSSVKGTQSLQDVSVRHQYSSKEPENHVMIVETNGTDADTDTDMTQLYDMFRQKLKPSKKSDGETDDCQSREVKTKKPAKKVYRAGSAKKTTPKDTVPEAFHQKSQRENYIENTYRNSNSTIVNNHSQELNSVNSDAGDPQKAVTANDVSANCHIEMESVVSKQTVDTGPGVHQNVKSGKHKKSSGRKVKRQQSTGTTTFILLFWSVSYKDVRHIGGHF